MMEARPRTASSVPAASGGVGLDVANAIRDYLSKAAGDTRLALALSVADGLAESRLMADAVARARRSGGL